MVFAGLRLTRVGRPGKRHDQRSQARHTLGHAHDVLAVMFRADSYDSHGRALNHTFFACGSGFCLAYIR